MKLITSEQMRECDRRTIEGIGLDHSTEALALMERAGWGIFAALCQQFGELAQRPILIFCGRGNNGGDGLVVARLLEERRLHPDVVLLAGESALSPDARVQWERYAALGGRRHIVTGPDRLDETVDRLLRGHRLHRPLLVDGLLGTGARGAPRGLIGAAVTLIGRLRAERAAEVLAIDLPTGVDADTGAVLGEAVEADLTVTMAYAKAGFFAYPGRAQVGRLRVADIGIPRRVEREVGLHLHLTTAEDLLVGLPRRAPDTHKGRQGRLLVVGGSPGLTGAPALAARAALRSGAGLVTLAVPERLSAILEGKLTEAMTYPCPETAAGALAPAALERITEREALTDVHVLGPGLGREEETQRLAAELVARVSGPLLVDADGLFALARIRWQRPANEPPPVLTPHPGEMSRLEAQEAQETQETQKGLGSSELGGGEDPAGAAGEPRPPWDRAAAYARARRCVLVLKGAPTVIADPEGSVWINPTGNAGLATGGSGDALTGIIAALMGQRLNPLSAARAGVFLHGLAADLAVAAHGQAGLLPSDVIEYLPAAWGEIPALVGAGGEMPHVTEAGYHVS